MTSKTGQSKAAAGEPSDDADATDYGKGSAAPSELEAKEKELEGLQAQQKQLVAEIAHLKSLHADIAAFEDQITSNSDLIERERAGLQTFVTNELKAVGAKTLAAVEAVKTDVQNAVNKAQGEHKEAVNRTKSAADAVERTDAEAAKATAAYTAIKQGVAEAKRVLGELKIAKKEAQTAGARNELAVAGYWLLEMKSRLENAGLPDKATLTSAWDDLLRKRRAAEDAKREADVAKAHEAACRKAKDESEKKREAVILVRLTYQSEAQKPETAA